jgi:large exoprotein involved in heme utilization and adhesion
LVQDGGRISTSTFGDGNAGNLTITATEIELLGRSTDSRFSSGLRATVASEAMGNAGTLTINTQNLSVREGAQVLASTFGNGNVGSLTITATDVELVGRSADGQFSSALAASVEQGATGNSGTLRIDTQNLSVREGAQILAATFGNGNAGNLTINATDVELVGRSADGQFSSALSASVEQGATGNGDTLIINTQNLSVRDGAQVTTVTFADGDGGNLIVTATDIEVVGTSADGQFRSGLFASVEPDATGNSNSLIIDTQRLSVRDGAFVSTSTFGDGDAGNLTVTATDVELIGTSADGQFPSTLGSEATSESTGRAGTLTVNADNLTIRDGATIDVRSQSTEAAGDLIINAPNILLDNQATLNGETTAGEGNIILNTSDLRLRNNSSITTNATGEATGGNITINTETLTALEDSDISANAEDAFGGRITINAAGIFGTAFRTQQSRFSDITATSELGPEFSGTVELNTELDPSSGLIDLTQTVVDPSDLIAQEFCRQRGGSEFVVTGKGGIAADPNDKADGNQIEVDLVEPVPSRPRNSSQRRSETEDNQPISSLDIIPARGWIRDENGDVILVGYDPTKTGVQRQPAQLPQCQPNLNEENGTRSPSVPSGETPIN